MDFMNTGRPRFIPLSHFMRNVTNQSPFHLASREDPWTRKPKRFYSPTSLFCEASLPYQSLKKGIFTIILPSTQILVANAAAHRLLNYTCQELVSMKFMSLVEDHHKYKVAAMREFRLSDLDQAGYRQEKLVELLSKDGDVVPVSLSFKRLDPPQRCLVVIEAIDRKTSLLKLDNNGKILTCDDEAIAIFEYDSSELVGTDMRALIPSICLDSDGETKNEVCYKQRLTGKNKTGGCFPLCLEITKITSAKENWQIVVWVYLNLSGLVIVNRELRILNCNYQFMKLLFGATRDDVFNQKITNFIPGFCDGINSLMGRTSIHPGHYDPSSRAENKKLKSLLMDPQKEAKENTSRKPESQSFDDVHFSSRCRDNYKQKSFVMHDDHCRPWNKCNCKRKHSSNESNLSVRLSRSDCDIHLGTESTYSTDEKSMSSQVMDSDQNRDEKEFDSGELVPLYKQKDQESDSEYKHVVLKEGYYSGNGKHWDGNYINLHYKVKVISFGDTLFYLVWISRDPWETDVYRSMTATPSSSIVSPSVDDAATNKDGNESAKYSSVSVLSQKEEILTTGDYANNYTNLEQIGKGAFGCVKMAFRHNDGLLVVTKFIKKRKVNVQSWVYDSKWQTRVPLEISLLSKLSHPNIVEVLDVFHNDSFFQLVMKKHGAGMDLFEFIERKPNSDEKLNSYIFRQIISAVLYLDSIGILHRDIKDENVIINEKFEVKLIDFGSATFKAPNRMFSVFYGTVEYCSPEVLQGNKYRGPELEIWALGVTLYVLSFGENPFYDVQETIRGRFTISIPISAFLFDLLHRMLDKDVDTRINIGKVATHPWVIQAVDINKYKFQEIVHCNPAEYDPPRYITEFTFTKMYPNGHNFDGDGDQTATSSGSVCSLQTTENTESFDQDEENREDAGGDFLSDESLLKSSTPVSASSSTNRGDIAKSAGSLSKVRDASINTKTPVRDRCNCKDIAKKRFSLDVNTLKQLSSTSSSSGSSGSGSSTSSSSSSSSGSSKCSESSCSSQRPNPRKHFSGKVEMGLVSDLDEMKLAPNESGSKSYAFDSGSSVPDFSSELQESRDGSSKGSSSHETEGTNLSTCPEICDTSDSRSFDGEDSELFWSADYDKLRNTNNY